MTITRKVSTVLTGELQVHLTDAELLEAYCEQLHKYLLQDAYNHLCEYIGYPDCDETEKEPLLATCRGQYGIDLDSLSIDNDPSGILELLVERYEHARDCNNPENDTWDSLVANALAERKEAV